MTKYRENLPSPGFVTAAHEMAHALMWEHFYPNSVEYVITDPHHTDERGVRGVYVKVAPGKYQKDDLFVANMAGWAAEETLGEPLAKVHCSDDIDYVTEKVLDEIPQSEDKGKYILAAVERAKNFLSDPANKEKHNRLIKLFLKRRLSRIEGEEIRAEIQDPKKE